MQVDNTEMKTGKTSADTTIGTKDGGAYENTEQMIEVLKNQETIIQGLGDVYFSVLLVDYCHDRVTIYRHEEDDGRQIAAYIEKSHFCWTKTLGQYCADLVSEDSSDALRSALSPENLQKAKEGFSINYQKKSGKVIRYMEVCVSFAEKRDGGRVAVVGTRSVDDTIQYEKALRTRLQMIAAAVGTMYPMVAEINLTQKQTDERNMCNKTHHFGDRR